MTLRESVGGDVQRISDQVDALLDSEDGLLVLCDGNRMVSYTQGFGVSRCQLELLGVELERAVRNVVSRQPTTNRRGRRNRDGETQGLRLADVAHRGSNGTAGPVLRLARKTP